MSPPSTINSNSLGICYVLYAAAAAAASVSAKNSEQQPLKLFGRRSIDLARSLALAYKVLYVLARTLSP